MLLGIHVFCENGLYGYKDMYGNTIIEPIFKLASPMKTSDYALAISRNAYVIIYFDFECNKYEAICSPVQCKYVCRSEKLPDICIVTLHDEQLRIFNSKTGEWATNKTYHTIQELSVSWARFAVMVDKKIALLDENFNVVNNEWYSWINRIKGAYLVYSLDKKPKVAMIDYKTGVRSEWYDEVKIYASYLRVLKNGKWSSIKF